MDSWYVASSAAAVIAGCYATPPHLQTRHPYAWGLALGCAGVAGAVSLRRLYARTHGGQGEDLRMLDAWGARLVDFCTKQKEGTAQSQIRTPNGSHATPGFEMCFAIGSRQRQALGVVTKPRLESGTNFLIFLVPAFLH